MVAQLAAAERSALLNVAEAFLSISEPTLVEQSFKTAATKLVKATSPAADEGDEAKKNRLLQVLSPSSISFSFYLVVIQVFSLLLSFFTRSLFSSSLFLS